MGVGEEWHRSKFERQLLRFDSKCQTLVEGNVLVDASFDNPNYWIRTIVFLNALGVSRTQLIGVLGLARRTQQQRTLKRLGVPTINDLASDIDSSTSRAAADKHLVLDLRKNYQNISLLYKRINNSIAFITTQLN